MTRMISERGDSKSNGALATVVHCSIYGLNPAEKFRPVRLPYPESDLTRLDPFWGLNGAKMERQFATSASQADQNYLASANEDSDPSRLQLS